MIVMKDKKTKIILALVAALCCGVVFYMGTICKLDGKNVCYDKNTMQFSVEENAVLKIGVESEATKDKLADIWAELYPETTIEIDVISAYTRVEMAESIPYDVYYMDGNEAMYFMGEFRNLGQKAQSVLTDNIPMNLQDSFNINGLKFVPQNVSGNELLLNLSLLEKLGLSREDVSSFEKIKENEEIILDAIELSFPFSLKDETTFYPFLTGGGWTLNGTHDGMNPDFDSEKFLESMEFIKYLSEMKLISGDERAFAEDIPYHFEDKFFDRQSLFAYISDVELANLYQEYLQDEWVAIPFPTYKEHHLASEVNINGYVVHKNTKYPSATAEVLRILRTEEFLELGLEGTTPILAPEFYGELEPSLIERIDKYAYSDVMTILALDVNPRVKSSSILDDINYMPIIADLFDGVITPEEAQTKFVELAQEWLSLNTPEVEETE